MWEIVAADRSEGYRFFLESYSYHAVADWIEFPSLAPLRTRAHHTETDLSDNTDKTGPRA